MRFTMQFNTCVDAFVGIIVLGMALDPLEESLPARLVCPQEYTATYSRAVFQYLDAK